MKFSKAMIAGLALMSVFSITASAIASRTSAPDYTYYSDATYTQVVGEKEYGCNGGYTLTGTVTAYYTVIYVPCPTL